MKTCEYEIYEPLFSRTLSIASSIFLASAYHRHPCEVFFQILGISQKKRFVVAVSAVRKLRVEEKEEKEEKEDPFNGCSANVKK